MEILCFVKFSKVHEREGTAIEVERWDVVGPGYAKRLNKLFHIEPSVMASLPAIPS